MDIDFLVQDTYALVRPQWKLATELSDAARLFSEAVAANYKQTPQEKAAEVDEDGDETGSDEAIDEDGVPEINDADSLSEEVEVSLILESCLSKANYHFRIMQKKPWPKRTQSPKRKRSSLLGKKSSLTPKPKPSLIKHSKE